MPKKERVYEYHVTGFWPFPLDMLRRDQARGATPHDQYKIDTMMAHQTGMEDLPEIVQGQVTVLIHGSCQPTRKRWRSFGWEVYGSVETVEVTRPLTAEEQLATLELIRQARASLPAAQAEVVEAKNKERELRGKVNRLEHELEQARRELESDEHSVTFRQEEVEAIEASIERMLQELD